MNLYTVIIDFEDRTRAVMQVEAANEVEALSKPIENSRLWHHVSFENEAVADTYGGTIVQTDKNGAIRESSS